MGRAYKLYSASSSSANAAASLRVTKKCRIKCISFTIAGIAGAAVDGYILDELSKQNVTSYTVNDTPDSVLAYGAVAFPVSGGAYGGNNSFVCDIPCDVGDTLYLNVVRNGTAPASAIHEVTIYTDA